MLKAPPPPPLQGITGIQNRTTRCLSLGCSTDLSQRVPTLRDWRKYWKWKSKQNRKKRWLSVGSVDKNKKQKKQFWIWDSRRWNEGRTNESNQSLSPWSWVRFFCPELNWNSFIEHPVKQHSYSIIHSVAPSSDETTAGLRGGRGPRHKSGTWMEFLILQNWVVLRTTH